MSLFSNLLNLHSANKPLEDFFTEIFAYFFSINKDLLIEWLQQHFIISDESYYSAKIKTQKYYEPLKNHTCGSQPDIVIELANETKTEIIFIESKIASTEGCQQLERYSEILSNLPYYSRRTLIYITRDYEPKEDIKTFIKDSSLKVNFYQLRWYQVYSFLKKISNDRLIQEILMFMELNMMSQNNQLSPIDILTIKSFNKTLNFMEASLGEEVSAKFKQNLEGVTKASADSLYQWKSKKKIYNGYTFFKQKNGISGVDLDILI
ncbi:hypothetical protein ACX27_17170 [Nostoc piscinale CENA21]|uniref:PD-(D/E)XK nuclease superfamily protein n=1 Tax=Nostoc piscinale CENA21 TaxID=224013 RepID=A0A0M4TXJ8_9NOSO|nr:PD-(D/E)XK nuclease family protein [Nostoc piscinale]ALF54176.1 hypothetical protein ACX27_17170 [Nostoc piscinale CENA21]